MTIYFAHYAGMFSRGQQSSIFSSSSLGNEDWAKLTRSQSINGLTPLRCSGLRGAMPLSFTCKDNEDYGSHGRNQPDHNE
jgi:hypothetical protein